MKQILCIGEALIDMICTDKGRALSDGDHFLKKAGGAPTNVAAAIAALGGEAQLSAKVGRDPFGRHLIEVMQAFGVKTEGVIEDPSHFTTFAFVSLMENGERDFYFNRGADGQLTVAEADSLSLDETAILHFGSATAFLPGPLQQTYTHMLQKARARQRFISFDPNYRHLLFRDNLPGFVQQSWQFLEQCDFFKVSDEEALLLTGEQTVDAAAAQLLQRTQAVFAITIGKEGTLLGHSGSLEKIGSIPVTPVDTTGAGDAFVGAVLYQLSQYSDTERRQLGLDQWKAIIANGNKAGARTCEYMGAMEAFKHLNNAIFR